MSPYELSLKRRKVRIGAGQTLEIPTLAVSNGKVVASATVAAVAESKRDCQMGFSSLIKPLAWAHPAYDNRIWAIAAFVLLVVAALFKRFPYALVVFAFGLIMAAAVVPNPPSDNDLHVGIWTCATHGISINGKHLRQKDEKGRALFGHLHTGDIVQVYHDARGTECLKFRCEFYLGSGKDPRPAGDSFSTLIGNRLSQ